VKWMSPEQLHELSYSKKSDVWSFACVCYEVMKREIPFQHDEIPQVRAVPHTRARSYASDRPHRRSSKSCHERRW
jgi:serine/threonine protein kinase